MFSIQDLSTCVAVADCGSVRKASVELGRTQPAVTQAIQRLEKALGFALLDRSGYRAKPTERGMLFLKRARASVSQAIDLRTYAKVLSRGNEAQLRISVHGSLLPEQWMHLIAHVPSQFPDTALVIRPAEGDAPIRRLLDDEADLAITVGPASYDHVTQIEHVNLGETEFVHVVSKEHLKDDPYQALAALPQIIVADFDDPETTFGVITGHRFWRVGDYRTKVAAIVAGIGWGAVPKAMIAPFLADGTVQSVTYRGLGPNSIQPYFLCHRKTMPPGPVASSIFERCRQGGPCFSDKG